MGGVDRQAITAAVRQASEFLALAMDNCPHQFVLCGTEKSIAEPPPISGARRHLPDPAVPASLSYGTLCAYPGAVAGLF